MKFEYFFSYAVGGGLGAIALAALLTDIARIVPAIAIAALSFWGFCAVVTLVGLMWANALQEYGRYWIGINLLIGLGVGSGFL